MKKNYLILFVIFLFANCEAVFVEDISKASVSILAPTEGSKVTAGSINFNWNPIDDANSYQLQIALPNFTNASQILLDTIITKTSFNTNLAVGNYQWRVKALNSDYQTGYTTTSFEVQ
jgi:hypothetical protein